MEEGGRLKKRSWILRGLVGAFLGCWLFISPQIIFAEMAQISPGLYMAGIPTDQFQYFAAPEGFGRQRSANWCWAASIQMVLNYHGLYVSQEAIVTKVYGQLVDQPAEAPQILQALNGWAPDVRGRYSGVIADPYSITGPSLVYDLTYRWPLIVGLRGDPVGHAYVLTAITYQVDPWNNPIIQTVVLRNPWPDSPSREEMSWNEFSSRVMFATRVHVTRL